MSLDNLNKLWKQRDPIDYQEGFVAYNQYRKVMQRFAYFYGLTISRTTSAFVALSPNNDYHGNLRSLASVLYAVQNKQPCENVTVTTYNACRNRAYSYLTGEIDFLKTVKGKKIRAFRDNILRPNTSVEVTVDGHMIAAWTDKNVTMKEAAKLLKTAYTYNTIAKGIREFATDKNITPCQMQAILWLTRKRVLNVKFNAQLSLFSAPNNQNKIICDPLDYLPYKTKDPTP